MTEWKAKRFWTEVTVSETGDGFAVHLDGRPLRTPAKVPLIVPSHAFAEAIAQEWRDQDDVIDPATMPATRTGNVAIDKVAFKAEEVLAHLLEYGGSDLLCYRAATPEALVQRQDAQWDPILDWCARSIGAPLQKVQGIMPAPQPAQSIERFRAELALYSEFELAAFHELVTLSGSLVLALAVSKGHVSAARAWELSRMDEQFQQEQWGEDEEAMQAAEIKRTAFETAAALLSCIREAN